MKSVAVQVSWFELVVVAFRFQDFDAIERNFGQDGFEIDGDGHLERDCLGSDSVTVFHSGITDASLVGAESTSEFG